MNFPSQIFFNDINHGYRAAILKKNSFWLLPFYMVWLLISIMKRYAERCALQLYQTSLKQGHQGKYPGKTNSTCTSSWQRYATVLLIIPYSFHAYLLLLYIFTYFKIINVIIVSTKKIFSAIAALFLRHFAAIYTKGFLKLQNMVFQVIQIANIFVFSIISNVCKKLFFQQNVFLSFSCTFLKKVYCNTC